MQKGLLVLLLVVAGSVTANAQSLKDLLYGGKLRMDSNSVLRKTDDLKSRIDTGQKKRADTVNLAVAAVPGDSVKKTDAPVDSAAVSIAINDSVITIDTAATAEAGTKETAVPLKTNTRIWKEYTDSLVNTLKTEVLSSKKIKKETYYVTVSYEIDTNGQVNITHVATTPENALLQAQIKQRMQVTPPVLNPVLDSANKPRKVKRNHNFTVTKE